MHKKKFLALIFPVFFSLIFTPVLAQGEWGPFSPYIGPFLSPDGKYFPITLKALFIMSFAVLGKYAGESDSISSRTDFFQGKKGTAIGLIFGFIAVLLMPYEALTILASFVTAIMILAWVYLGIQYLRQATPVPPWFIGILTIIAGGLLSTVGGFMIGFGWVKGILRGLGGLMSVVGVIFTIWAIINQDEWADQFSSSWFGGGGGPSSSSSQPSQQTPGQQTQQLPGPGGAVSQSDIDDLKKFLIGKTLFRNKNLDERVMRVVKAGKKGRMNRLGNRIPRLDDHLRALINRHGQALKEFIQGNESGLSQDEAEYMRQLLLFIPFVLIDPGSQQARNLLKNWGDFLFGGSRSYQAYFNYLSNSDFVQSHGRVYGNLSQTYNTYWQNVRAQGLENNLKKVGLDFFGWVNRL